MTTTEVRIESIAAVILEALSFPPSTKNMETARGVAAKVAALDGARDAEWFDMGWNYAQPIGMGGFPDEWFEGWMPLPAGGVE